MMHVGVGWDVHRLVKRRRFLLAGVEIPARRGELGHSDGDVLAHAVCDALLGAACLGDIGLLFPASDLTWKNADSMALLKIAYNRVKCSGWHLVNLDCTICCEEPRVLPFREKIRDALAQIMEVNIDSVFVKGKTTEGIGLIGRGRAVEALAVCLLSND